MNTLAQAWDAGYEAGSNDTHRDWNSKMAGGRGLADEDFTSNLYVNKENDMTTPQPDPLKKFVGDLGRSLVAAGGVDLVKELFKSATAKPEPEPEPAPKPAYGTGHYAAGDLGATIKRDKDATKARDDLMIGLLTRGVEALEEMAAKTRPATRRAAHEE